MWAGARPRPSLASWSHWRRPSLLWMPAMGQPNSRGCCRRASCPQPLPLPSGLPWPSWPACRSAAGCRRPLRPSCCRQDQPPLRFWSSWSPSWGRLRCSSGSWPFAPMVWSASCWSSCCSACQQPPACALMPMAAGAGPRRRPGPGVWRASRGCSGWSSPWPRPTRRAWRPWRPRCPWLWMNRCSATRACAAVGRAGRCAAPARRGTPECCWRPWSGAGRG